MHDNTPAEFDPIDEIDGAELPELAVVANRYHADARSHARSALECACHAGRALNAAKDLVGDYGNWMNWVESNFTGSYRTAAAYMQLARNVQSSADLDSSLSINAALKAIAESKGGPKSPQPKPKAKATPVKSDEVHEAEDHAHRVSNALDTLWDYTVDLDADEREQTVTNLRQLADGMAGAGDFFPPGPDADYRRSSVALREAAGHLTPAAVVELIIDELGLSPVAVVELIIAALGPASDHMAGLIADALVRKFGSWAAFDKARKRYNLARDEDDKENQR